MIMIAHTPLQFECFKAYEEDTYYTHGSHVVIFRTLYHFATLVYEEGVEIPQVSVDGNYYKIPQPTRAECGDVFAEKTELQIDDASLREQVEAMLKISNPIELDEQFERLGFQLSSRQIMYGAGTAVVRQHTAGPSCEIQESSSVSINRADMPLWLIS
jgi:hypothetical protein